MAMIGNKFSFQAMTLGLLAAAAGSAVTVQGSRVFCRFVSASRTTIARQDGYTEALRNRSYSYAVVDIAESICNEATGGPQVVGINEQIRAVAFAQAEAIAEVVGTCSGDGTATLLLEARRQANARAEAVGKASAEVLASSGVCGLCETGLQSMISAVETLTVEAVAQLNLDAEFQFNGEPLVVNVVQRDFERKAAQLLTSIVGEVRTSAIDGCSANVLVETVAGDSTAECDVSISADSITTEIDAIADAGLEIQAFGCDGPDSFVNLELQLREVAVAVAQAVTQATAFCQTNGGPGTMACAVSRGTVNSVASATASAFATAISEAVGPECDCELAGRLNTRQLQTVIARTSAASLASVCVDGENFAIQEDFQIEVEERLVEALAEVVAGAVVSVERCELILGVVAEINPTTSL